MTKDIYGVHFMLRISHVERRETLGNQNAVAQFLLDLVDRIGMKVLAGPLTGMDVGPPEKRGCSGVIILFESHAAIHTYSELGTAFLDIFACRQFNVIDVKEVIRTFFGSYEVVEEVIVPRGANWTLDAKTQLDTWFETR